MDNYRALHEYKESLEDEIAKYAQKYKKDGKLVPADLEMVDMLTHTTKNLCKILDEGRGTGYSQSGPYYSAAPMPMSYDRDDYGMSMAGRRRDSMGRYSSHNDPVATLQDMIRTAPDEATRMAYQKTLDEMTSRY